MNDHDAHVQSVRPNQNSGNQSKLTVFTVDAGEGSEAADENKDEEQEEEVKVQVNRTGICKPCHLPSSEELEEHMMSHIPFRSWCDHCIRARGVAAKHVHEDKEERYFSVVHMDYMFFTKKREIESDEEFSTRAGFPILVMMDVETGVVGAQFIQQKGVHDWSIKVLRKFLETLGHKKVAVRSHQERVIIVLRKE